MPSETKLSAVLAGPSLPQRSSQIDGASRPKVLPTKSSPHRRWYPAQISTWVATVVDSVPLGISCAETVSSPTAATLTLLVTDNLDLALGASALALVPGTLSTQPRPTPTLPLKPSNKKSTLMVLFKPDLWSTPILCTIKVVFTSIPVVA